MKNLLYIFVIAFSFMACQNKGQTGSDNHQNGQNAQQSSTTACYIRAEGQDTTWLSINIAPDGAVSGTYDWVPYEKDSARGTFTGKKEGDIIMAVYNYMIEGSQQQQEMMFKLTGEQLAEAQGELEEAAGGLLKLKDPSNVEYLPFTKVNCK